MSEHSPFFSIVMPVYKVERYIADAVADALVQTDGDFELILVDDCSPDRSIEAALAVADGDERMRVVRHDQNRWVSAARNTGIAEARGTWLLMPDSDDRFEANLLERMRACIEAHAPDVVYFNHVDDHYDAQGTFLFRNDLPLDDAVAHHGPELGRMVLELEKRTHLGYPWNKAFRLDIIRENGVRFPDKAPLIEDFLFTMDYLDHVETLVTVPDVLYRYAKRLGGNLTNKAEQDYYPMHRRRIQVLRDFVERNGALDEQAKSTIGALYARFILSSLERSYAAGQSHAERVSWLDGVFEDPLFCELAPFAQAENSRALATSIGLLQRRDTAALLAEGRAIHLVRTKFAPLYMKAKMGR